MPYFERPPAPHDWRWWVGIVGRSLITLGVLMFAFVAYQLWGTGIQTARAQNQLDDQFEELLQSTTTSTSTTTTTIAPSDTTAPSSSTTSTVPVAPARSIGEGEPVAKLRIPAIGLDWTVVEGVGAGDLEKGPGHFPETPMPGEFGNAAIAGHRTTHGAPFYDLDELEPGDLIEVDTVAGTFVYSVTGSTVVKPSEYAAVIPTVDNTVATLTLATCTPAYSAKSRLIIRADLVADQSATVMRPPSATTPDDTTTTSVPDTLPGETVETTATTAAPPTTVAPAPPSTESDAFSQGWLHDKGAIPQAILWGLALVGIAIGSYFVGKKAHRLWVAWLVGAVPFVVALYFFFENVNSMLPPGI